MLAYVFSHHPAPGVEVADYERRLAEFHRVLRAGPPPGFRGSAALAIAGAPWAPGASSYEDWYVVDSFAALGALNDWAVSGPRRQPHDSVAVLSDWGAGGLYRLISGEPLAAVRRCVWMRKPAGQSYEDFFRSLGETAPGCALWQRQLTLGPATEFCLHGDGRVEVPPEHVAVVLEARRVV